MDGVDAALLRTDGRDTVQPKDLFSLSYDDAFRARLRLVQGEKGPLKEVAKELTERHAEAVKGLLEKAGLKAKDVALIGFHGQTVLHEPWKQRTVQIGDGALLAKLTGIDVVNDFRAADVAAGGQGAPLVPIYHQALARPLKKPLAVLNIGGVANITYIGENELIAFDTGPGNAMMDDWMLRHKGVAVDQDGALAAAGCVEPRRLMELLNEDYFTRPWPKSLDRHHFSGELLSGLSVEDGVATLSAFTTGAVAKGLATLPSRPKIMLVAGGGRHNATLMKGLQRDCGIEVKPVEAAGWNGTSIEAEAFAYLAVRSKLGLPYSFPTTTGVPVPMSGGVLTKA